MNDRTRSLIALGACAAVLALGACSKGSAPEAQASASAPAAESTDWTQENPTEPAVPVNLPNTPMTNGPATQAAPSPAASGK